MKTPKEVREHDADELRKARRTEPMRRSGKTRHTLYRAMNDEADDEETDYRPARESAYDYLDDEE